MPPIRPQQGSIEHYWETAQNLMEKTTGFPRQRLNHVVREEAERMANETDVAALWEWAKTNTWRVEQELDKGWSSDDFGDGRLVRLLRRAVQSTHQERLFDAVHGIQDQQRMDGHRSFDP
jgi:hypothetical protein